MMSKLGLVLLGILVLGLAGFSFAQEPAASYGMVGMPDPYAGPTPSGMRFGDMPQEISVQTGEIAGGYGPGNCPGCLFGVKAPPCDPAWSGPCMDWKTIGWYSSFRDKNHGGGCGGACRCRGSGDACMNCY